MTTPTLTSFAAPRGGAPAPSGGRAGPATALVIAEHDNASVKGATLNTVTAAAAAGGEVHILIAGHDASGAAEAASKIAGVAKVLHADAPGFEHGLAENVAAQVIALAGSYSHIVFPATAAGKNVAPRVAALLDGRSACDSWT